jgi:hypothetical protein
MATDAEEHHVFLSATLDFFSTRLLFSDGSSSFSQRKNYKFSFARLDQFTSATSCVKSFFLSEDLIFQCAAICNAVSGKRDNIHFSQCSCVFGATCGFAKNSLSP